METLESLYDKHPSKTTSDETNNNVFSSKIARRLLVLVFVQLCQDKLDQIDRLKKSFPLIFLSNQVSRYYYETKSFNLIFINLDSH